MNETLKVIQERYSCRTFTGQLPNDAKLSAIAQAAIQSPSSMNRQPWQVIVVRNTALMAELEAEGLRVMAAMEDQTNYQRILSRGGKLFYGAPCIILVAIDPTDRDRALLDCGIVCQTIALAAQAQGLGSCICGFTRLAFSQGKAAYFKERFGFPAGYDFGISVLIGEAAGPGTPHEPDAGKLTTIA